MAKIVFGCGYLGLEVAKRWRAAGDTIYAVTRSNERAKQLEDLGLQPIVSDLTQGISLPSGLVIESALFAVGFDRSSGQSIRDVYVGGLKTALDALPAATGLFLYISSTGVYGESAGEIVDEQSPCHPQREGGQACLAAERLLTEHPLGSRRVVLRLAGIYGPGRIPKLAAVQAGEPVAAHPQSRLNLIHRDDAVAVLLAAERLAQPPALYTVSDGHPVSRQEFYSTLADLVEAPPPTFDPSVSASSRSGVLSDKRVSNRRMSADLQVRLQYPSFQQGLPACLGG